MSKAVPGRKIAMVTGAGSGIGKAVAVMLAERGAHVVVSDIDDKGGAAAVAQIQEAGGSAEFVHCDVSDSADCEALVATVVERHGRLDWACNNAGILGSLEPTAEHPIDQYDKVIAINQRGVFLCMRFQLPVMLAQDSGAIVNICSETSMKAGVAGIAYTASKHAVHGMTKVAALEVAQTGVRVNGVAPGNIRTEIVNSASPEMQAYGEQMMPAKRYGDPSEIAEAVTWLLSDAASLVNGHMLVADTGWAVS